MTQAMRPAVDILEDLYDIIAHYPPLQTARHHLHVDVQGGEIILSGHVRTPNTYRYLVDHAAAVRGVSGVNSDSLFIEEAIRLEAGRCIPTGVIANVLFETVILTGKLPDGVTVESVVSDVAQIPGVERVITKF